MAVAQGPFLAAVLLLVSSWLHSSSPLPACPESCTCQSVPLLNCSSAGLSFVPQQIQDSVTDLDLSHNLLDSVTLDRPHRSLRNVWLGNNSIARLSLCVERSIRGRRLHRLRPQSRRGCVSWAPTLQLLSVERNQLEQLPQGLEGSESLQVLQLSFNRISTLRPGDLTHLRQLKELHLQHNLITSLHPQMFQDLAQLQVLDLSFNMLTSLHPLTYLSLRNIGADVQLDENMWQCDCSMRSLRRQMAYDSSRGLQTWSVVCVSPSIISGRDLLQVEEHDLNCFSAEDGPELHRDVTVYSGSEILLSCSTQDSTWWTPSGQASVSQPQAGLLINDVTERDAGLYVCVSEKHEVVSVFNLEISKIGGARRKTRSLPRTSREIILQDTPNRIGQERNQRATQSDLALAVCLSVFITFLIAFILGVLARPCIDVLWGRITKKKSSSATHSVSSVEQRQYDNEAYCNGEEPEQIGAHRERRVTFSTVDYREDRNVQYYDTVAGGNQETINNDAVIECEARDTNTAGDSGSENSVRLSITEDNQRDGTDRSGGHTHSIEFEHIPDPVEQEKRRSLSSCSDSSQSDKVTNKDQMTRRDRTTPKFNQLAEDSVQQRADSSTDIRIEVSQISVEGTSELPGFSSEPFADWSPHKNNTNLSDPELWQENEEQFEFSDSVHSTSARSSSVRGSFNDSKLILVPTYVKQRTDDLSSSSSYVSEDEPTQYTVNSDQEDEDKERNHNKPEDTNARLKQDASFEQQIHNVDSIRPAVRFNQDNYRYDTQRPVVRPDESFSSHSSDSDVEDYTVNKGRVPSLAVTSHSKSLDTGVPSPSAAHPSSSSSESEPEIKDLKVEHSTGRLNEGLKINKAETLSTDLDRICIPQIKRRVDIKAPLPATDSSSSDESTDETTKYTKRQEQGEVSMSGLPITEYQSVTHDAMKPQFPALDPAHAATTKRRAPLPPINSSSDERQGKMEMTRLPIKISETASHDSDTRWPALDLENTTRIKRRLDIKAPSPPPDSSSSSDSEGETMKHTKRQEQEQMNMARPPSKVSETVRYDPQTQWPLLDLEHTKPIKRRLDIKAPSLDSDSSSSSDSEDETTHHTERPRKVEIAGLPFQESQTGSHDADTRWPALDLEHIPHIKRRLDIKAPSPPPDSSSSSDSEDDTTNHINKQEQGQMNTARLPSKVPETALYNPQTQWPLLDLQHTKHVKRRLDVKAPSPDSDSSSSSDNEDETTHQTEKPGKVEIAGLPLQESQTGSHDPGTMFPSIDLEHIPHIKRRLDIKAPSPPPDSSSSSDSEDETTHHIQQPGKVAITGLPFQESQTESRHPGTKWPSLDFEHTVHIKRRLDIKAPSPPPDSSSSSDSEEEAINHINKQEQGQMNTARLPSKVPETARYNPQTQWPLLDLQHTKHVKRRLDVKAPSPDSDSSSSSDNEDETTHQTEKPRKVEIAGLPLQEPQTGSHDPGTMFPSIDLEHIPHIKRRLDIKAPSPPPDSSSSSDSEDETTHHIQKPGKVAITGLPFQESQTESRHPDTRWPALDFEHTVHIKRRLDIKAPSPPPDSSSSSDSEEETINHINKQEQGQMNTARLPSKVPETARYNPQTQWPLLDLQHTKHIKRHLDIKAPSPDSDSSSSSDSEDETLGHNKKQRPVRVDIAEPPFEKSQTGSHDPGTMFPSIDLENIPHIKRRLDIKAPSPPLEPHSKCEIVEKHEQRKVHVSSHPSQESQGESHDPDTRWPVIDLEHTIHVKRRLDIKAPPPSSDSSSSSDSEDETTHQVKKQEQGETHMARPPIEVSQTVTYDPQTQWPLLDLQHTKHVKRRLDVKAPSPATDSSSSSDSETERPGKVDFAELPLQKSQTINQDPETQWPALDLEHNLRIKRRLDIKASSPVSDSSSSGDSEDETTHSTKIQRTGVVGVAGLPFQESQTVSHDPETQWPTVDLGNITRIKRRLDIKAPSPPPDSLLSDGSTNHTMEGKREEAINISPGHSSSSSDEQEKGTKDLRYPRTTVEPDSRWPRLDLDSDLHVKRRLDIRARSPPSQSSSSSDESESGTTNLPKTDVGVTSHKPEGKMPDLKVNVPPVKRRLNIKAPSPQPDRVLSSVSPSNRQSESNSSRSDSEDERRDQAKSGLGVSAVSKATEKELIRAPKIPVINISPRPKTDHNIKLEKYTVVTDDVEVKTSDNISRPPEINPELQSRWATMDLGISRFRKRLEITSQTREPPNLPSSPPPDSPSSSSSESGTGSKSSKTRQKRKGVGMQGIIHTESSLTAENKPVNVSSSLKGWNDNSGNSVDNHTSLYMAQAVDIKMDQPQSQTEEVQRMARMELKSQTSEDSHSRHPNLGLANIPHIKRTLDIRAPLQRESSTSSISEDEMMAHSVPDLSLGVPRVKRRLDIKGPSPESSNSSSSSSESENEVTGYTVNQSRYPSNTYGVADSDHLITYKRLIMKPSSPLGNSFTHSGMDQTIDHTKQRYTGTAIVNVAQQGPFHSVGDRDASLSPKRVPSMSFDDVVKKRLEQSRSTTDLDMPPEIRWTGVGRQLSDLSLPGPRRHLDAGLSSPQQAPPAKPEIPPPDSPNTSSSDSDDNIKQDRGKADVTLTHKHSSLSASSVSLASSRALDKFDSPPSSTSELLRALSEDKNKRKGLSALKAMSSERQKWDTVDGYLDKGASPPFDDHSPQGDTSFSYRRSEDVKPLAKQPPTQLRLPSTSVDERRATDLLYDIPRYRRHGMGDTEPPQRAPPPIPATPPPPYEAVGLSRRSPQSNRTQGLESTRSYLQQSSKTVDSTSSSLASQNLAVYFDSSNTNISEV